MVGIETQDVNRVAHNGLARVTLFGLPFGSVTVPQAVSHLLNRASTGGLASYVVVTPNVDHVVRIERDQELRRSYLTADLFLADGAPIVWAARLLGATLPGRVTGADLMPALLQQAARGMRVAIVGSRPEWAAHDIESLRNRYPNLVLKVFAPPMGVDPFGAEAEQIGLEVERFAPRLVFVCLGFPRQEHWAIRHRTRLHGAVVLCCGAALDFLVSRVPRAPSVVRAAGLEWLWRLASEPRRLWRRYLVDDPAFVGIVLREWRARRIRPL
jgi:N-acetylglucosaminyldiphosphoundecaprenol N-acetyl-beta-D-mannosaminyltransferase